jgi:hypothetical protein
MHARRSRAGAARRASRGGVSAIGSRRSTSSVNVRAGLLAGTGQTSFPRSLNRASRSSLAMILVICLGATC